MQWATSLLFPLSGHGPARAASLHLGSLSGGVMAGAHACSVTCDHLSITELTSPPQILPHLPASLCHKEKQVFLPTY